jgi:hypothetical protein
VLKLPPFAELHVDCGAHALHLRKVMHSPFQHPESLDDQFADAVIRSASLCGLASLRRGVHLVPIR